MGFGCGYVDLLSLDGADGFVIQGIDEVDSSGASVCGAGDVKNDGVDDVIIRAPSADPNNKFTAGESYVIFGSAGVGSDGLLALSQLSL